LWVFKTKEFARFARRERIADGVLIDALARAERGLIDADLGRGLDWFSFGLTQHCCIVIAGLDPAIHGHEGLEPGHDEKHSDSTHLQAAQIKQRVAKSELGSGNSKGHIG
jgi:RelE toxin of RelE / RelB toxin-antitoxin system